MPRKSFRNAVLIERQSTSIDSILPPPCPPVRVFQRLWPNQQVFFALSTFNLFIYRQFELSADFIGSNFHSDTEAQLNFHSSTRQFTRFGQNFPRRAFCDDISASSRLPLQFKAPPPARLNQATCPWLTPLNLHVECDASDDVLGKCFCRRNYF